MSKKRPRGGPKKLDALRKDERMELRMTTTEKEGFSAAAELSGMPLSGWIRVRLRAAAKSELESENRTVPFI